VFEAGKVGIKSNHEPVEWGKSLGWGPATVEKGGGLSSTVGECKGPEKAFTRGVQERA